MRDILDSWFYLQNRWDEEVFLSIPHIHRESVPILLDGKTFYSSCCIETFEGLLKYNLYTKILLLEVLVECITQMNINKIKMIIRLGVLSDEEIATLMSSTQNMYLLSRYKEMFVDSNIWKMIDVHGITLQQMCIDKNIFTKMISMSSDEVVSVLCIIAPMSKEVLSICGRRTPTTWAYRVPISTDLLLSCIHYNVSIDVIDVVVSRLSIIHPRDVKRLMESYPPSMMRESVYYKCLSIMSMSEEDFLIRHMPDSKRCMNMRRLKASTFPICKNTYANTCNLYGIDVTDIPSIYTIETRCGHSTYLLDAREIIKMVSNDTYVHPYTRETIPSRDIIDRYISLIDEDIPTCIDVGDVPDPVSNTDNSSKIQEMIEKHDLIAYMQEMVEISCRYNQDTLISLSRHPNIIRLYNDSIPSTILMLYPQLKNIVKTCI